jgi:hypothetical protein
VKGENPRTVREAAICGQVLQALMRMLMFFCNEPVAEKNFLLIDMPNTQFSKSVNILLINQWHIKS